MAHSPIYVDNAVNINPALAEAIAVGHDGVNWDFLQKSNIKEISGLFSNTVGQWYEFPTKTIIVIQFLDNTAFQFEAQEVKNQATWIAGTQASLETAKTDIVSWL